MKDLNALIVGGTSGLGLELAHLFSKSYNIFITGRSRQSTNNFEFLKLDLSSPALPQELDNLLGNLPQIDLLIYAAGYFQEGEIGSLEDNEVVEMISVGLLAPSLILKRVMKNQKKLSGFVAITSTSQWTPRLREPVYTAVKAGLGMLANSFSLENNVGKVLVAGPAGMKTKFWEDSPRDLSSYLDPKWVAQQIVDEFDEDFEYKFIKIMRDPPRVERSEKR